MGLERHDAIYTYLQGQNSAPALKREAARIRCKIGRVYMHVCTCMWEEKLWNVQETYVKGGNWVIWTEGSPDTVKSETCNGFLQGYCVYIYVHKFRVEYEYLYFMQN